MPVVQNLVTYLCVTLICFPTIISSSTQGQLVDKWAKRLGKELNDLGLIITKAQEIEDRYKFNNAQVQKKDPEKLLLEIVGGVTRMLNRKMDAIKCIVRAAEKAAENFKGNWTDFFTYHSSKYSPANDDEEDDGEEEEEEEEVEEIYEPMLFNHDSHFYNIAVNTSYSSVHVPTNVYDRSRDAANAIQWSEMLDDVFRKNYESDPALSWQYFGSSTGIMRHYPAMRWVIDESKDTFDCRVRTWYIEAATCTKDIVLLVDSSGSMQGMNKHIASLTVYTILQTLSNNDYVNILNYSLAVNYTVPCFQGKLIQATPENIETFKIAVNNLDPQGKSNAEQGLIESFRLLEEYRKKRNCIENVQDCSQAIMVITDGLTKNYTDFLLKYNSANNGTVQPVRIFTYLIGKEINKLEEIASMSCRNRGYFTLVSDLETVTEAVFKYVNVIARPLILHRKYPISWTHTYVDTYTQSAKDEPYRLLISAAIPAYNRSANISADIQLLGIAGTDVTISSIQQLTFPYKIGVNAHAFIVTNNGYVLMHPGLRPMFKKKATPNYNSIDFTEVQQLDDGSEPRQLAQILLDLRADLIYGDRNVTRDVPLKYHYNNMQRISREKFDFYYQRIKNTSFTIALALPNRFGYYAVQVPDEIDKNKHARVSILSFFSGTNWKIHPQWVYCKYHYLEGHEFTSPEKELLHFLARMYNKNFTWNQQYEYYAADDETETGDAEDHDDADPGIETIECDTETKRLRQDDYYCDKELINMLVFDAKSTMQAFKERWTFKNDREQLLFRRYNATLRFVATMSGLTRWEYIFGEENNTNMREFGDDHPRAIDETWYKSAVLQHQYDIKSFVYSVPLLSNSRDDLLVTGSYAIFPKDAGAEAPASVVGFQFSHSHLVTSFFDIANDNTTHCEECVTCGKNLDCYIVDSSGYIIVSDANYTGIFLGEIEGCVLDSMLEYRIFERLPIYDYQSLCYHTQYKIPKENKCNIGKYRRFSIINWIIEKIFWFVLRINFYPSWYLTDYIIASSEHDFGEIEEVEDLPITEADDVKEDKNHSFIPCDHRKYLYVLNQHLFLNGTGLPNEIPTNCPTKYYYAKMVPKSNLLLVAVRFQYTGTEEKFTTKPEMIIYENISHHPCQKLQLNDLTRRRLLGCYNMHEDEKYITACGFSSAMSQYFIGSIVNIILVISIYNVVAL